MAEDLPIFESELEWQIDRRARIQKLLFELHKFLDRYSELPNEPFELQVQLAWMVDAAFSLWRSAFLTDVSRDRQTIYEHTKEFIRKVLEFNAITFADDYRMRGLAVGYYNANAKYRVDRMYRYDPSLLDLESCRAVAELTGDLATRNQAELWDLYYRALCDCFERFKADWHAKRRPREEEKEAEPSAPATASDGSTG